MGIIDPLCRIRFFAACRRRTLIAVFRMVMVIYVAAEIGRAMKPRADANENASHKPFRTIIAVGSASVRWNIIITVRTVRSRPDFHGDLSLGVGGSDC